VLTAEAELRIEAVASSLADLAVTAIHDPFTDGLLKLADAAGPFLELAQEE
jgi:hypothetical protein